MEATIVNNAARAPWNKGAIGLDDTAYGTHTLNRTKALLIDRRTKSLRAGQLLFGHSKLDYVLLRTMSRVRRGSSSGVAFSHGR
jgi:hypothetical protein